MAPRPEFLDEITQYQQHMFGSDSLPNEIGLDLDGSGNITWKGSRDNDIEVEDRPINLSIENTIINARRPNKNAAKASSLSGFNRKKQL